MFWDVRGPAIENNDILPLSGSVAMENGVRTGEIILQVLPDDIPELTENFQLRLLRVEGGAEISPTHNSSSFSVRYECFDFLMKTVPFLVLGVFMESPLEISLN